MDSIMTRMAWAIYPPPFSEARMEASKAEEALSGVGGAVAAMARAMEARDPERTLKAFLEALVAEMECRDAAWAAEYHLSDLRGAVIEWERTLCRNESIIVSAHREAMAVFDKLQTMLALLNALYSAGVIPVSP
jgi:hypothetical protein